MEIGRVGSPSQHAAPQPQQDDEQNVKPDEKQQPRPLLRDGPLLIAGPGEPDKKQDQEENSRHGCQNLPVGQNRRGRLSGHSKLRCSRHSIRRLSTTSRLISHRITNGHYMIIKGHLRAMVAVKRRFRRPACPPSSMDEEQRWTGSTEHRPITLI